MKTLQKPRVLSLVLALVLSFSLCPFALADLDPSDYSDLKEDYWAYDSIMYCSEWNIVTGFEDGTFRPDDQVTSVQFIVMLTRKFFSSLAENIKRNLPEDSKWYSANAMAATVLGFDKDVTVNESAMSRYDMAQVIENTLSRMKISLSPEDSRIITAQKSIADFSEIPSNRMSAVSTCYALGALIGMSDGKFHGEESMTRAQACVVITRIIDLQQGETPATPSQPQQPTQPETPPQPQQPETPEQTTTGTLANGQPITEDNVLSILADIQEEYPQGTPWGDMGPNSYKGTVGMDLSTMNNQFRGDTGGIVSLRYACGGFMAMVSVRIFGESGAPCREVTDPSKVRPGDIVIKVDLNDPNRVHHYAIARDSSYKDSGGFWCIPLADGNANDMVRWSGEYMVSRPNSDTITGYRVFTRYPE